MLIIGQVSKPELLGNLFYLQAKYAVFKAKVEWHHKNGEKHGIKEKKSYK